jgi:hypothetical protein
MAYPKFHVGKMSPLQKKNVINFCSLYLTLSTPGYFVYDIPATPEDSLVVFEKICVCCSKYKKNNKRKGTEQMINIITICIQINLFQHDFKKILYFFIFYTRSMYCIVQKNLPNASVVY